MLFQTALGRHAHGPLQARFETKPNQNKHYCFQKRIQGSEFQANEDVSLTSGKDAEKLRNAPSPFKKQSLHYVLGQKDDLLSTTGTSRTKKKIYKKGTK